MSTVRLERVREAVGVADSRDLATGLVRRPSEPNRVVRAGLVGTDVVRLASPRGFARPLAPVVARVVP
ncbi:MAG TPA: hypothetical protein VIL34_20165 [Actinopolymorphaceae bacterium]